MIKLEGSAYETQVAFLIHRYVFFLSQSHLKLCCDLRKQDKSTFLDCQ